MEEDSDEGVDCEEEVEELLADPLLGESSPLLGESSPREEELLGGLTREEDENADIAEGRTAPNDAVRERWAWREDLREERSRCCCFRLSRRLSPPLFGLLVEFDGELKLPSEPLSNLFDGLEQLREVILDVFFSDRSQPLRRARLGL